MLEVSQHIDHLILLVGYEDDCFDLQLHNNFQLIPVGFQSGNRPYNMFKASLITRHLIEEEELDLVHDTFAVLFPLFYMYCNRPPVYFVTSLYSLNEWRMQNIHGSLPFWRLLWMQHTRRNLINALLEHCICRKADAVVIQAPGLAERISKTVPDCESRLHVIPNAVDVGFWKPSEMEISSHCSTLKILTVANVHWSRGIFELLDVARLLLKSKRYFIWNWVVASWSPLDHRNVMRYIEQYGLTDHVRFLDKMPRNDLRILYQNSDLFVYQTINDGSPRVVMEALACGLPVVASHHPGIDVLDPGGDFVAFTEYGDVNNIVAFIESYLIEHRSWSERAKLGRDTIVQKFSTVQVARLYADFYSRIIER